MNVADLFVSLGIKGAEKTVGAISGVRKGLNETSSAALETKVAILAAVYALEQLFQASGEKGTALTNLSSLIGVSTKTLQQYEYAARQVGISNEEMDATFKSLQSTMTKQQMGEGQPKGLGRVEQLTGGISSNDLRRWQEHPEEELARLQKYALLEKNIGLRNETLKSFGLSDSIVAALSRNAFTPGALNKAPTYNEAELRSLDRANIAWSNLNNKIQMAIGHFNAMHGGMLVNDISRVVNEILKLAEAFNTLSQNTRFFETLDRSIQGWVFMINNLSAAIKELTGGTLIEDIGQAATGASMPGTAGKGPIQETVEGWMDKALDFIGIPDLRKQQNGSTPTVPNKDRAVSPYAGPLAPKNENQNININQNLNFAHDGKDHAKTSESVKKSIRDAARQLSSQAQGS